jgi:predicted RNA-binding Zn-ribbon protein involved in translation (DUF1610 family)
MLSVGRELNINQKAVSCQACSWEGEGAHLSTGLVPVVSTAIHVYSYRCPACGSFNIARKAKLLQFSSRFDPTQEDQESGRSTTRFPKLERREG